MVFLWFLLFLGWPAAEIWIFIAVGHAIGWLNAIALTIVSSIAGSMLMRVQGFAAMNRFLQGVERGELPVATVLDGMGIFIAGALLLMPGFLSDILGLVLFIPPVRRRLTAWLFRQILQSPVRRQSAGRGGPGPRPASSRPGNLRRSDNVVDAEFETVEPRRPPPAGDRPDKESP
jgi:UPF0716 protein FxsA